MTLKALFRYFLLPAYRPGRGIHELYAERRMLLYALIVYLFLGAIYTVSVQLAYMRGFGAVVDPFIKIPATDYYFWQRFYQIPFFVLTGVVFSGSARLLSSAFGGSGSFERIFALNCMAMTFPMFLTMWLPETVLLLASTYAEEIRSFQDSPLINGIHAARQIAGILWPMVIIVIGIRISEKIRWTAAAAVTLIAMLPTAALMVIFIR